MYMLFEKDEEFIYWDKKTNLTFKFSPFLIESPSRTSVMPEGKRIYGKRKDEIEQKFVDFVLKRCSNWKVDDLPVTICKSAAGYYAGCMTRSCEHYCRVSWYGNDQMIVACWMNFHKPSR